MNKINDEKIVNLVKKDCNYTVKTTSQSILNQYEYEMNLEKQKAKAKKKKTRIALGSIFGGLAIASAVVIGCVFLINPDDSRNSNQFIPDIDPQTNNQLKNQLITFAAFAAPDDVNVNKNNLKRLGKISEDSEQVDTSKLKDAATLYDEVQAGVNFMYEKDDVLTKTKTTNYKVENIQFEFVTEFRYKSETSEPFAYYYFNPSQEEKDDEETVKTSKAYYVCESEEYIVDIVEEFEVEEDETESETKIILRNINDGTVSRVKKEIETSSENNESENSLSITTYESYDKYKNDEFIRKIKTETEVENDVSEMILEIIEEVVKASYKIDKIDDTHFDLLTEYKSNDVHIKDEIINLEYREQNRIYLYKGELLLEK